MAHVDRPCGNGTDFSESPTNTAHKQDPDESEDDVELFITVDDRELQDDQNRTSKTKPSAKKKKDHGDHEAMKGEEPTCDFDETLDQALEDQAKQHNLTAVNVRNILHEVITNEHVVAMMKAAITDTEDMPLFEPKMTRSKLKEVVEKGVVIPAWNLSPIKKPGEVKTPQFVDIPLEEDDSSDEEYQPEEGEEDETAEESLLESDVESTASSPHGRKLSKLHRLEPPGVEEELSADGQENSNICGFIKHISADVVPMGPPPPPKERPLQDSTFMEKLHAVDEELAFSPVCMDTYQSLNDSLIACRTRSKRPLKGIPIGKLEAELQAPDITPDMYEQNTADDEDWKWWLRGLMEDDVCNEEEGDDEDDPEYNFLEDIDEPDTEDLRNDRAVRITKKEVSKLMEELFETFQDEMGFSHMEEQGPQDEDSNQEGLPDFNTPQALKFDEPLVNLLNEQHRTVRAQIECLRMRKSLMKASIQSTEDIKPSFTQAAEEPRAPPLPKVAPVMSLDAAQRRRLQQQMQQHVQLLTQVHLLSSQIPLLSQQADTARMFLMELCSFAEKSTMCHRLSNPEFQTMFETRNLGEALQLLSEFHGQIPQFEDESKPLKKNVHEFQSLPRQVAWIMATRPPFMYPELLPGCALKAKGPRDRVFFTKAEDNLLALGLKHFEGTDYYKPLISKYLVTAKTAHQLTIRIKNLTMKKTPDNIIKFYKQTKALPIMFKCCDDVPPQDARAPIEREKHRLPFWLKSNLGNIEAALEKTKMDARESDANNLRSPYPLIIPPDLVLDLKPMPSRFPRKAWRQKRPSILKPLLIRPTSSSNTNSLPKTMTKMPLSEPFPIGLYARLPNLIPMQNVVGIQPVDIPEQRSSQVMVAPVPITPAKVIQPSILTQKARKPLLCGVSRRRTLAGTPAFKSAPLIHPAPVIFAVPSTSVKLVSLGSACGVIQPVNTGTGVPISTVLLNPASLPLTPNVVSSPMMEPYRAEHKTLVTKHHVQDAEPLEDEQDCVSIAVKVEVAERLRVDNEPPRIVASNCEIKKCGKFSPDQGESIGSCNIHVFQVPKSPDVQRLDIGSDSVKTEPQEGQHVISHQGPDTKGEQVPVGEPTTLESVLPAFQDQLRPQGLGQLDLTLVKEPMKEEDENVSNPSLAQMEDPVEIAGSEEAPGGEQRFAEEEAQYHDTADPGESPKNTSSSTDGDVDVNSPVGTHPDSSSPSGRLESGNDKDGPEEEEEEDFDDLTQDEDEEEMSSASEESVLSVPELQETMEKLTWLASERRLSQEGDSEENSQEENSEQEEEEEEEGEEGIERSAQKEKEMTDEVTEGRTETAPSNLCDPVPAPVETSTAPTGERRRGGSRGPGSHRVRNRRGRTRTNKDASKLLLLYDENILAKDPLREQKDMAFAQSYLNRVREALQFAPGKYEEFLRLIYQFETKRWERTAMDLYDKLRELLKDWPQLLKDFAAFLLPEQALECGLFEEQQAFDKSRKFLRQLEICFMENTAQYQKIIKLLQSCAECPLQEINKLKSQMWQLLKGHNHLQDEFSLFFDQLRPPASRLGEFEVVNWTEDKGYKFDGFEEVTLPDLEEDEEQTKALAPRSKRKKEITQGQEKETDWPDGGKDCPCSCHESGAEQRLKRCKRRMCSHCSTKTCERVQRTRDPPDPPHRSFRLVPAVKEGGPEEELSPRHSDERLPAGNGPEGSGGIKEADRPQSTAHNREGTLIKLRLSTRDSARPTAPNRTGRKSGTGKCLDQASEKETDGLSATVPGATKDSLEITPRTSPGHSDPIHIKQDLSKTELPSDREQILTVCAKNITVGSSGEKVILWTREADRVILTMCQERGAQEETFAAISVQLGNKSPEQVSQRFQELVKLFQTAACVTSSDEEEAGSTTDQLSDQEMDNED